MTVQDRMLKEKVPQNADQFSEAILSYEVTIREKSADVERLKKELNDARQIAKKERAFMLSAWYNLNLSTQKKQYFDEMRV